MRIISGSKKGHPLVFPKGEVTRPTTDRVRESIFNIIGTIPSHARVLDLFAGTGAFGLEALSRGANFAVFVEQDKQACLSLKKNVQTLGFESKVQLSAQPMPEALSKLSVRFDLVFIDPPYQTTLAHRTLELLSQKADRILEESALLVVEHMKKVQTGQKPFAEKYGPLTLVDERNYGQTGVSFYEYHAVSRTSENSDLPRNL